MKPEEIAALAKKAVNENDVYAAIDWYDAVRNGTHLFAYPDGSRTNDAQSCMKEWAAFSPQSERRRLASWLKNPDGLQLSDSSIEKNLDRIAELLLADDAMAKRAGEYAKTTDWDHKDQCDIADILRHFAEAR